MRTASTWLGIGVVAVAVAAVGALLLGGDGGPAEEDGADGRTAAEEAGPGAALHANAPARSAATAAAATFRIEGRVTEGGRPAAGVKVVAARTGVAWDRDDPETWRGNDPSRYFVDGLRKLDDPAPDRPAPDAQAESDGEGAFVLLLGRTGQYSVTARADPPRVWASGWASVSVSAPKGTVSLDLLSGAPLRGRVLDPAGAPATAAVSGSWQSKEGTAWTTVPEVLTDPATGGFVLPSVPSGKGSLSVRLPGRATIYGFEVTTPFQGELVIRLGAGGVVRGRLTDVEGKPVAGADLTVSTGTEGSRRDGAPSGGTHRGRSGDDGTYRIEGVVPGKVSAVSALAEGFLFEASQPPRAAWTGAVVSEGRDTTIDLVLSRGGSVAGRVVEAGTGNPIAGATVVAHRSDATSRAMGSMPRTGTAGDDGAYRIDGVALGKWVLVPSSPRHYLRAAEVSSTTGAMPGGAAAPPELVVVLQKEGEVAERHLEMVPGLPVRGRVVGPDGVPVAAASVRARNVGIGRVGWQWGVNTWQNDVVATSGDDGTFEAPGLPPRDDWILSARKEALVGEPSEPFRLAAGQPTPEIVLRLSAGASVAGRVLDEAGEGVTGATVSYWANSEGYQENGQASTGVDGAFTLEAVPPGTLQLNVWASNRNASHSVEKLEAGERRTGVEIRFERGVALSGVLVDGEGKPVPSKSLTAQGASGGGGSFYANATTDADGRFSFPSAKPGRVNVQLAEAVRGRQETLATVTAPASDLRLVLPVRESTLVSGRVTGPGGEPVPVCSVAIGPTAAPNYGGTDPNEVVNGEFRRDVDGVPPFEVSVTAPRDARGRPVNLRPKKVRVTDVSSPVVIALEGGLELAGRVVGPGEGGGEAGVEGVRVTAGGASAMTDATGAFSVGGLEAGEVEIGVQVPPRFVAAGPVRARVGDRDVLVRLRTGATIAGRVLAPDGRPQANVSVQASWKPGGSSWTQVDGNGHFKVQGLPPDAVVDLRLASWGIAGPAAFRPAEVLGVAAGTDGVVVQLEAGVTISGRLVATDGTVPTDVGVRATREGAPQGQVTGGNINADGTFAVGGLAPGPHVLRVVRNRGVVAAEVRVDAPARDLRVEVAPGMKVAGRLEGPGDLEGFAVVAWSGQQTTGAASTGADGTFSLDVVAGMTLRLTASKVDDDRYALREGYVASAAPLVLRLEAGASVEGVVEGTDGSRPWVFATADRFRGRGRADADGRFKVRGLPPGRYRVETWLGTSRDHVSVEGVEAGANGVRLRK